MNNDIYQLATDLLKTNIPAEIIFQHCIDFARSLPLENELPPLCHATAIREAATAYRQAYETLIGEWREEMRKREEAETESGGTHHFISPMMELQA